MRKEGNTWFSTTQQLLRVQTSRVWRILKCSTMLENVSWCDTIRYAQGDMITQKVFSKYLTLHEGEFGRQDAALSSAKGRICRDLSHPDSIEVIWAISHPWSWLWEFWGSQVWSDPTERTGATQTVNHLHSQASGQKTYIFSLEKTTMRV